MHLDGTPRKPHPAGQRVVHPAPGQAPGHQRVEPQRRGDGRALEVARLAGAVLGDARGGDVEAGEAGQAAEDEEGEEEVVEGGAES